MLYDPKWEVEAPATVEPEPWRKLIKGTAQVIRDFGWCQSRYRDETGAVCLFGALGEALDLDVYKDTDYQQATLRLHAAIDAVDTRTGVALPYWNDEPGRTKEEVLAMLDGVAQA